MWGFAGSSDCKESACSAGTQVQSLGREDPLEREMATHSSILAWKNPMDRGAWWAAVHGVAKESGTTERLTLVTCRCDSGSWVERLFCIILGFSVITKILSKVGGENKDKLMWWEQRLKSQELKNVIASGSWLFSGTPRRDQHYWHLDYRPKYLILKSWLLEL